MGEVNRLTTVLAVDEFRDQSGIKWTRSVQGQDRGDVLQGGRLQIPNDLTHAAGFELKDPLQIATRQQREGIGIFRRQLVGINAGATAHFHKLQRLVDHREVLQPQEIHLQQTHGFHVFHEVLGDHLTVVVALQRHQLIQWVRGDHHTGGMHPECFVGSLDPHRHVDPTFHHRIGHVLLAKLGIGRFIADHCLELGGLAAHNRDELGQTIGVAVGDIEHPSNILQHGL